MRKCLSLLFLFLISNVLSQENDYFIDANTYLINKVKAKVSAQGQSVDIEQIMSDYKSVDGITMAMKIESKSPMV